MTLIYRDKNGQPLKGAALQSAILSEARGAYFARYPEQLAALKTASPEDSALIERCALEAGSKLIGQAQRRSGTLQAFGTILAASCTASLLALFVRPALIPHAFILGTGLGSSMVICRLDGA
ncbi:MAG: hypothetical protein SWY16_04515 [Cyanobacteriota bacterium]|nr:hypothetical protein [Cyanobacteriota bacterium]